MRAEMGCTELTLLALGVTGVFSAAATGVASSHAFKRGLEGEDVYDGACQGPDICRLFGRTCTGLQSFRRPATVTLLTSM